MFCYGFGLCIGCLVWARGFITLDGWLWLWFLGLQSLRFKKVWQVSPWKRLAGCGCLAFIRVLLCVWLMFWLFGMGPWVHHLMVGYGFGFGVSRVCGKHMFGELPL